MKKLTQIITLIAISSLLVACGNASDTAKFIPQKVVLSKNTIRQKDEAEYSMTIFNDNYKDTTTEPKEELEIGELFIDEMNNQQIYNIEGTDIRYKDRVYKELYTIINSIQSPYSQEALINFIVKAYNIPNEATIFCELKQYIEMSEDGEVGETSPDEEFTGHRQYDLLKEKYGVGVDWKITLYTYGGENEISIVGCSQYIFIENLSSDVSVKMQDYLDSNTIEEVTDEGEVTDITVETPSEDTAQEIEDSEENTEQENETETIENSEIGISEQSDIDTANNESEELGSEDTEN